MGIFPLLLLNILRYPTQKTLVPYERDGITPVAGAVVSHTDITERKAIEQMKDEFISIASHELKTPLTSLKGIVHILQLSFLKKMKGEGAKLLSTMDIQLDKLTKIIGDLLNVNTLPGKGLPLNYEEFEFSSLVQETVENVAT